MQKVVAAGFIIAHQGAPVKAQSKTVAKYEGEGKVTSAQCKWLLTSAQWIRFYEK